MVRSIGICGLTAAATAALAPFTAGSIKKLIGRPIRICAAAQAKQVLRQPMVSSPQARQRPSDGRGKTRDQRDAGDGSARCVAIDAPERCEGGIIEAKSHADAEQQPGDHQHRDRIGAAEQRQSRGQRQIGNRQHLAAADQIDLPADARAEQRPKSPARPRRRQRSSSRRRRGRARSDRPGSPADNSSKPMPASAWCRAPE